jgi:hypothetical protein
MADAGNARVSGFMLIELLVEDSEPEVRQAAAAALDTGSLSRHRPGLLRQPAAVGVRFPGIPRGRPETAVMRNVILAHVFSKTGLQSGEQVSAP